MLGAVAGLQPLKVGNSKSRARPRSYHLVVEALIANGESSQENSVQLMGDVIENLRRFSKLYCDISTQHYAGVTIRIVTGSGIVAS